MPKVYVVGVGMTKFTKPGSIEGLDYPQMSKQAGFRALHDAGVPYSKVQSVICSYVYGDSTQGQRAVYDLGMTGIPVYNVNNNCCSGATALQIAYSFIKGGLHDCVMCLGFEKMKKGSLQFGDGLRANPLDPLSWTIQKYGKMDKGIPEAPQYFGNAGLEYMGNYNHVDKTHFAKIAFKNHLHSVNNPYSQFRKEYSLDSIKNSRHVFGPMTMLQCCPTSDGAASVILVSEKFVIENNLQNQAVEILDIQIATDTPSSYENLMDVAGFNMTQRAAQKVYNNTGVHPSQVQVVELHDCFSANELISYDALSLCPPGGAGVFIDAGDNTYGGRVVVNPSGGLISKGHPLGATGLAQCSELCWQLRRMAGKRQVAGVEYAMGHNVGLGGAAVVSMFKKMNNNFSKRNDQTSDPEVLEVLEKNRLMIPQLQEDADTLCSKKMNISQIWKQKLQSEKSIFSALNTPNSLHQQLYKYKSPKPPLFLKISRTEESQTAIQISDLPMRMSPYQGQRRR